MKKCNKCGIEKELDMFYKGVAYKDGLGYSCKKCANKDKQIYLRTRDGLITQIYSVQRNSSRERGYNLPNYDKEELKKWVKIQPNFEELYINWVKSGYKTDIKPSIDRVDDYKSYTLDNIQLITWKENFTKSHNDRRNGINNKHSKAILQLNKDNGNIIKQYYSINKASRETNINISGIFQSLIGDRKTAGGYKWEYFNK